jgi:low affinity Fe/Cu permease
LVAYLGYVDVVTYYLSVLAIVLSGVVLIQNYRDTAAMQAKLDEIVVAIKEAHNDVVGLEHEAPEKIKRKLEHIERQASETVSGSKKTRGYNWFAADDSDPR